MSLTITGILTIILSQVLDAALAEELAADLVLIIGIIVAWYGRYRLADITWFGSRK